jgi:hypothetical protein
MLIVMNSTKEKPSRNTKEKLSEARYFLDSMMEDQYSPAAPKNPFGYHLNAFLCAFRSITLIMQKELAHYPGFKEWYAKQVEWMEKDAPMKLLVEMRNMVLKQESIPKSTSVEVRLGAPPTAVASVGSVTVTITDKNGNIIEQSTTKEQENQVAPAADLEKSEQSSKLIWHIRKTPEIQEILGKFPNLDIESFLQTDIITICETCFGKLESAMLDYFKQDE